MTIAALLVALLAAMVAQPGLVDQEAHAQDAVTWAAYYYGNPYLVDPPRVVRHESRLAFNWGGGSPASEVPADHFSARFATDAYFSAGTYRFSILADDGVKLWIGFPADKRPTLNTYDAPRPGTLLTADVPLSAGFHHIQIDYREVIGDAYLYVHWDKLDDGISAPNFPIPARFDVQWTAQYFNNNFLGGAPNLVRAEAGPNHHWGADAPAPGIVADHFTARWIVVQHLDAGRYTISVTADDGVRVNVNGRVIIDAWHTATGQIYRQMLGLAAGQHTIIVEYLEQTGLAHITFTMAREPGVGAVVVTPLPSGVAQARVTAWVLNVRDAPWTGNVITRVRRGEVYPVVGRTTDSAWWQLNVNGTIGWASGAWLTVAHGIGVGVITPIPVPTVTPFPGQCPGFLPSRLVPGVWGRVTPGLPNNLRAQPSLSAAWIGQIPGGGLFRVLGGPVCADNTAWFQVNYSGLVGWTMEGQGAVYWLVPH